MAAAAVAGPGLEAEQSTGMSSGVWDHLLPVQQSNSAAAAS